MRMLFFLLGMIGFISAGMLHMPLLGVLGFVLAVIALFLAAPQSPAYHHESIIQLGEFELRSLADREHATLSEPALARQVCASRRLTRHGAHHRAWHVLPSHTSNRHLRATQKWSERS